MKLPFRETEVPTWWHSSLRRSLVSGPVARCLIVALGCVLFPGAQGAPQSGYVFQSDDVKALQDDNFRNPGMLWVDEGEALFQAPAGEAQIACSDCHTSMRAVATTFPKRHAGSGELVDLTGQVQWCRTERQNADPVEHESRVTLALTAYVAHQSRGLPLEPVAESLAPDLARGQRYFESRRGQLNLACRHCHELSVGKYLRGDLVSEGHGNGYPAYRLEWQQVGSLHRRLRACDIGVRAEPHAAGSKTYIELELYLRARAAALPVETPAVRR